MLLKSSICLSRISKDGTPPVAGLRNALEIATDDDFAKERKVKAASLPELVRMVDRLNLIAKTSEPS